MWQLVAGIAAAVTIIAGSYTVGRQAGKHSGYADGYAKGHQAATATLNANHKLAVEKLNREAAEALVAGLQTAEAERVAAIALRDDARNVAAIELARIAGDRDALAGRVRDLLRARTRDSNPRRHAGVPGAVADPGGDEAAAAGRLLLDRIGTGLAGLASDADATLAQYQICYRLATEQKRSLDAAFSQRVSASDH
jgi:hypothetical protein